MSLINKLSNKSIEESIDLLCAAYEEKQASHVKESKSGSIMSGLSNYFKEMSPELKYSLLGGALGAGAGGLGMAGSNLIKNKKITLRDLLYGSLLGAVPGASVGYLMSGHAQRVFDDIKAVEEAKAYRDSQKDSDKMPTVSRASMLKAQAAKDLEIAKAKQEAFEESNRIADTGNRATLIQNLDINQRAREASEEANKADAIDAARREAERASEAAKKEMERIAKNRAAMSGAGSVDDINKAYEQFKSKSKK